MKKKIFVLLIFLLFVLSLFFYFRPQPVSLEMPVCAEDGEVAYLKISAAWYRHWNGKRTLEGEMWVDDTLYRSIPNENWNWKDQSGRDVICRYIGERNDGGMPLDVLRIEFTSEWVYLTVESRDKEGGRTVRYLGPANTVEEYNLLYQKWLDTWFHE